MKCDTTLKRAGMKSYESIGALRVPKRLYASDGTEVRMTANGLSWQRATLEQRTGYLLKWIVFAIGLLTLLSISAQISFAAEIDPNQAIQAIFGEARGEGRRWDDWDGKLVAMTAVGEAIRNRGHLKGVYGLYADSKDPEWVEEKCLKLAKKAWEMSATTNLVKGADHWENLKVFGVPYWAKDKSMKKTVKIGDHQFYKRVQK